MKDLWVWLIVAAAAGFLAGYLLFQPQRQPQPPPAPPVLLDEPSTGSEDAPVTIIEFADFRCGFCLRHFTQTLPILKEEYIATGTVQYVFRNFPILGVQSRWAALAAECAHEQGHFWEYHDQLFALTQQGQEFLRSRLKSVAAELGLDAAQFNSCLDSEKYLGEVQEDLAVGQKAGVTGTPSFLVNGELVNGAQPIEVFRQKIDEALAKPQTP